MSPTDFCKTILTTETPISPTKCTSFLEAASFFLEKGCVRLLLLVLLWFNADEVVMVYLGMSVIYRLSAFYFAAIDKNPKRQTL